MRPVIQKFVNIGREGVVSITGFIGRSADVFVTRRSTKIFQRSRPVGVGVCYEFMRRGFHIFAGGTPHLLRTRIFRAVRSRVHSP